MNNNMVAFKLRELAAELEKNGIRTAMARGRVFLDEDCLTLEAELRDNNIKVIKAPKGTKDEDLLRDLLEGRILITRNSKDFVRRASSLDMGIIALEHLSSMDPKRTVAKISDAIIDYSLWSKRHGFIIILHDESEPTYSDLID